MFSQACAKNSVHGGRGRHMVHILSGQTPPRQTPPGADTPLWADTSLGRHLQADTPWADTPWSDPPWADTLPSIGYYRIWSTSGWYASYWNAFLLCGVVALLI